MVAIFSVARLGRRFWFIEGGIQMGISMIVTAVVLGGTSRSNDRVTE
jgi:hypothetical protein